MTTPTAVVALQVRYKYGRRLIYPCNEAAVHLTTLTGRKTLYDQDIALIEALGFKIEWVPEYFDIPAGWVFGR